jgi:hypothetical protein
MEGRGRVFGGLIALALALALAGCGASEQATEPVRAAKTSSPATTFAPLVQLDAREKWRPMSTEQFLRSSSLEWTGGPCPLEANLAAGPNSSRTTGEGAPPLDAGRLGGPGSYSYRPRRADCRGTGSRSYSTADHTRPHDSGRAASLADDEGFNLDLLTSVYGGDQRTTRDGDDVLVEGVPAYYAREQAQVDGGPGLRLTYWLLYGREELFQPNGDLVRHHEGDWERIDVLVRRSGSGDRYLPVAVRLHVVDGRTQTVPWQQLERAASDADAPATHPVIFAARASHTPYARPGQFERRVRSSYDDRWKRVREQAPSCPDCLGWRTWAQLRPVRKQPWYGYGGGWGANSSTADAAGPLGPSPYSDR